MSALVVIAAGGTGGHMFPAMALAREVARRGGTSLVVCDRRGARYLDPGTEHVVIQAVSPAGSLTRRLLGFARLALGFLQSLVLLMRRRPAAIAAFGGYASLPVALAAQLLRIPVLAHEQNGLLGRANRLIARRAARLALSFPDTRGLAGAPEAACLVTGNPVRTAVAAHADDPFVVPAAGAPVQVLVVGGSQGARVFSDVVPAAVGLLSPASRARLALTQQCRPEDLERVRAAYADLSVAAELAAFFDDLPARLACAHLVISRSGASSTAELLALGRPALLVPYRFAADDHQRVNAEIVAAAGAAWLTLEPELTPAGLAARLEAVLNEPGQLAGMAVRAKALGRPDAASALADALAGLTSARLRAAAEGMPA